MNTVRTSITINEVILSSLRLFSQNRDISVSEVIEEAVVEKLRLEQARMAEKTYYQIDELIDSFQNAVEDPNFKHKTVDEILYSK